MKMDKESKEIEVFNESGLVITDNVIDVKDTSDAFTKRVRVYFKNGLSLSVVRGSWTYGGDRGLFEIAPFNKDKEMDGNLLDGECRGDDVLGYCDVDKVNHYIAKIGKI